MNEEKTFENRPVTMNPKKNLLEIEEHMYILDDVEKPNVFRNMFPYSDIPKIPFNDRIVPHNMPQHPASSTRSLPGHVRNSPGTVVRHFPDLRHETALTKNPLRPAGLPSAHR